MYARLDAWMRAHPAWLDVLLTAGVALLALAELVSDGSAYPVGLVRGLPLTVLPRMSALLVMLVLLTAPLLIRRRHPTWCFTLVSLGALGQLVVLDRPSAVDVAVPLAAYGMAAYGEQTWARRAAMGVGVLGAVLGGLRWTGLAGFQSLSLVVIFLFMVVALSWVLGYYRRTRRLYVEGLEERAHRLEAEREQQQLLAAQRERARIAREMHDIVAHSLSVIVLQADGGTYAAQADPQAAVPVLQTISDTGRQALTEMRRLLGVLREESAADLAPQPGLSRLAEVVTTLRAAGHPTELTEHGQRRGLPPGLDLTAFRVVQEAATNVLKHAGTAATVTIDLDWRPSGLAVRVTDDGRGAAALPDGTGHGLLGMHERVAVYGGTLHAAPASGGGFLVSAYLPAAAPPVTPGPWQTFVPPISTATATPTERLLRPEPPASRPLSHPQSGAATDRARDQPAAQNEDQTVRLDR